MDSYAYGTAGVPGNTTADRARKLVDRAIADWNKIVVDFNYENVDPVNGPQFDDDFHLTINAVDLNNQVLYPEGIGDEGVEIDRTFVPALGIVPWKWDVDGRPYAAKIEIDNDGRILDTDSSWLFIEDESLDDSRFTRFTNPFELRYDEWKKTNANGTYDPTSRDEGPIDLLRAMRHEIAHAIGFTTWANADNTNVYTHLHHDTNSERGYDLDWFVHSWDDYHKYEADVYRVGFGEGANGKYQVMFTMDDVGGAENLEEGFMPFYFHHIPFTDSNDWPTQNYQQTIAYTSYPLSLPGVTPWPNDPVTQEPRLPPEPYGGPTHLNDLLARWWTIDSDRTVRQQISDLDAMILADAYGYDINFPSRVDTMYADLWTDHTLYVRGGDVDSFLNNTMMPKNDKINIYKDDHNTTTTADDEIVVEVNTFSYTEWDQTTSSYVTHGTLQDPLPTRERFPAAQVQKILIESRGNEETGQDEIVIGQSAGDPEESPVSGPLLGSLDIEIRNTEHAKFTVIDSEIDLSLTSSKLDATLTSSSVRLQSDATFGTLSIGAGSLLEVGTGDRLIDVQAGLTINAQGILDLNTSDMIVRAGAATRNATLSAVTGSITSGYNNGAWGGFGIRSSAAASNPSQLTTLGVMINDANMNSSNTPWYSTFGGESVTENDILVKYTYYGDADLSGIVDGTDLALIDNGYNAHLIGWLNGDFNYDGHVDGTDYALIDNAFYQQLDPL